MSKQCLMGAVLLVLGTMGCTNTDSITRLPVSGEVFVNGKPLEQGSINFLPSAGTTGPSSGGKIEKGKFEIPASQGPVAGKYRIEILATRPTGKKVASISESDGSQQLVDEIEQFVPAQYNRDSTLMAEISPETASTLQFDLEISDH